MQVFWKRRALADLDRIATFIAKENPQAAQNLVEHFLNIPEKLSAHPRMGRIGRLEGTRELPVPSFPYVLAYQIDNEAQEIEILAVFHDRQKWPEEPIED